MKIAIVGSGISAMSSAYFLNKAGHDITMFEKNDYIGGHTNTYVVKEKIEQGYKEVPIDTGFIVFNKPNYPNLYKLFNQLDVPYTDTDMSFAITSDHEDFEYCGSTLNSLFCQRSNIFSPKFYKLLWQINKFNKLAPEVLETDKYDDYTIEEYFHVRGIGDLCFNYYLLPMSVALWSAPQETIRKFPIKSLVRFFNNHALLGFTTQHSWMTVKGGSTEYRQRLIEPFRDNIKLNSKVTGVKRLDDSVVVSLENEQLVFDAVVMGSHADQTFNIIQDKTELEQKLLAPFSYQKNIVQLHTDHSMMPKRKLGWASWNHSVFDKEAFVTYWMNRLQPLNTDIDYFVTLNAHEIIQEDLVLKTIEYEHPIFTTQAMEAQASLHDLNDQGNRTYFCGAYFKNGFHEDGIASAVKMCENILAKGDIW